MLSLYLWVNVILGVVMAPVLVGMVVVGVISGICRWLGRSRWLVLAWECVCITLFGGMWVMAMFAPLLVPVAKALWGP